LLVFISFEHSYTLHVLVNSGCSWLGLKAQVPQFCSTHAPVSWPRTAALGSLVMSRSMMVFVVKCH